MPEGKTIHYIPLGNSLMQEAVRVRNEKSTDLAVPTGAIVARNGVVLGQGANQSALKNPTWIAFHKKYCIRRMLGVPSGQKYWICPGCAGFSQHAEARAIKDALRRHGTIAGADLYLYGHWWACKPCWDKMIKAGIQNVYLVEGASELF